MFDKINLDIGRAKPYARIGNSRSGKSTLAKILMEVTEDYGGDILEESNIGRSDLLNNKSL